MATLKISVDGEPKTGKTALLANIAAFLRGTGISVVWENPELPNKPNAQITFPGDKVPAGTVCIMQEVYSEPKRTQIMEEPTALPVNPLED